jgi:hypothetical protein
MADAPVAACAAASFTLVPTPSVEATSTGWRICWSGAASKRPPKPPWLPSTAGV